MPPPRNSTPFAAASKICFEAIAIAVGSLPPRDCDRLLGQTGVSRAVRLLARAEAGDERAVSGSQQ